jgi:hypothetical protein
MTESTWVTATPSNPCPACGGFKWCRVSPDGAVAACRYNEEGTPATYSDGSLYWKHVLGEADASLVGGRDDKPVLADEDRILRDQVYRSLLAKLGLSERHRDDLYRRGLDDAAIERGGYASLPNDTEDWRVDQLRDEFTADQIARIPGLAYVPKGTARMVVLAQPNGLLVPVRDPQDRIVALKVRRDYSEPRYVYLSNGQPGAGSHAHVPAHTTVGSTIRITEGELKADVATLLSGVLTISVPGVQSWRLGVEAAQALGVTKVLVAYDADKADNPHVARAERSLLAGLHEAGFEVHIETWDAAYKGVDDALLAGCDLITASPGDAQVDDFRLAWRNMSQASQLVDLGLQRYELGVTDGEMPYAVPKHGIRFARPFNGEKLKSELSKEYHRMTGITPGMQPLAEAVMVLRGYAEEADPKAVPLRMGEDDGKLVVDLGDREGRAVVLDENGWEVVDRLPILVRRTRLTGSLPVPQRGGSLELLRELVNMDDCAWALAVAWLVCGYFPLIDHPVALLRGTQGAAKSTAATYMVCLIDPSSAAIRAQSEDERDWAAIGRSSYVCALDNVSNIKQWLSDAMCRACTGDAYVSRTLYTNDDVTVMNFRLQLMMTSIDPGSLKGDLADRMLPIDLPEITGHQRRRRSEVDARYTELQPLILGALLDLVVQVRRALPSVHLDEVPRLADAGFIMAAIDQVTGLGCFDAYMETRLDLAANVIEGDPIASAVRDLVAAEQAKGQFGWSGTIGDLYKYLKRRSDTGEMERSSLPKSERGVGAALTRVKPALKQMGIIVEPTGRHRVDGVMSSCYRITSGEAPAGHAATLVERTEVDEDY